MNLADILNDAAQRELVKEYLEKKYLERWAKVEMRPPGRSLVRVCLPGSGRRQLENVRSVLTDSGAVEARGAN